MSTLVVPSDIEIAQRVKMRPIEDVAAELGLERNELDFHGKYIAKIPLDIAQRPIRGRLVVVTATNPTPAGEGKSTVSVGLAQALRRMGKKVALCIREPSLGPVFGVKGGAAGGGYAQVVPMDDINLHFTGDFHAISSAHALLAAMLDNHLQQGNALGIDPRRITWPRTIDMNDRALRNVIVGLGGVGDGVPREEHFIIVPASEIMAIVALATSVQDLEERLARIILGSTYGAAKRPVTAGELRAGGAMALLLKDAIRPNLVQTLEGGPGVRARRSVRQHRARVQQHSRDALGARARRSRRDRSRIRIGSRRRKVLRHQVPHGRLESGSGGHRRDGAVAQDARRRRQEESRRRGSARARARPAEPRETRRERAALRRAGRRRAESAVGRQRSGVGASGRVREVARRPAGADRSLGEGRRRRRSARVRTARRCSTRRAPSIARCTRPTGRSRRRSTRSFGRSMAARAPTIRRKRTGRSRTSSRSAWGTRRCAWPRRSIRSPTTPRSSAARADSVSRSMRYARRPAPGS